MPWARSSLLFWHLRLASSTTLMDVKRTRAIFSDLDGTLVHFPAWFEEHGSTIVSRNPEARRGVVRSPDGEQRECRLLPSSTMGDGCVSERTVELVDALRAEGVLFFVVTAARKSTLLERMPLLPAEPVHVDQKQAAFRQLPPALQCVFPSLLEAAMCAVHAKYLSLRLPRAAGGGNAAELMQLRRRGEAIVAMTGVAAWTAAEALGQLQMPTAISQRLTSWLAEMA